MWWKYMWSESLNATMESKLNHWLKRWKIFQNLWKTRVKWNCVLILYLSSTLHANQFYLQLFLCLWCLMQLTDVIMYLMTLAQKHFRQCLEIWDVDSFLNICTCVFRLTKWNDCGKSPTQTWSVGRTSWLLWVLTCLSLPGSQTARRQRRVLARGTWEMDRTQTSSRIRTKPGRPARISLCIEWILWFSMHMHSADVWVIFPSVF